MGKNYTQLFYVKNLLSGYLDPTREDTVLPFERVDMGTNCALLVADLFLFCYERDFMMSLSDDKQADVIDAFNPTSRYLDDI